MVIVLVDTCTRTGVCVQLCYTGTWFIYFHVLSLIRHVFVFLFFFFYYFVLHEFKTNKKVQRGQKNEGEFTQ